MQHNHPWLARFIVSALMVLLAFTGLIFTDVRSSGAWSFWKFVVPVYAILALGLSWYLRKKESALGLVQIWHEVLHWAGLFGSVYLLSFYVDQGVLGRFEAALSAIALIALGVFLAGIYIETTFLFIGIIMALFGATVAFIQEYLYAITVPLVLLTLLALVWFVRRKSKKETTKE